MGVLDRNYSTCAAGTSFIYSQSWGVASPFSYFTDRPRAFWANNWFKDTWSFFTLEQVRVPHPCIEKFLSLVEKSEQNYSFLCKIANMGSTFILNINPKQFDYKTVAAIIKSCNPQIIIPLSNVSLTGNKSNMCNYLLQYMHLKLLTASTPIDYH